MKTTGFRSFVLYILLFAFCGGFVWFLINLALNGSTWATQPYNGHIYGDDTAVSAGTITDRSGMVLAKTEDGSRVYAESEDIRRALLHTVGDSSGYIGTAVQAVHRSQLVGYNPITGLARTVLSDLGNNLVLTVDANASAAAYNAFNGRNGSAFVYNYKTGEVLVKVSAPTYDPMNVPEDLNDNEEYNGVFLDHTLSSTYTPGSIFKLVTAAAAMQIDPPLIAAIRLGPYGDFIIGNAPLRPHAAIVMGPRPHADTGAVFRIEKALNVGRQLAPDGEPLVLLRRVNRRVVIVVAAATAQPAGQADKQAGD